MEVVLLTLVIFSAILAACIFAWSIYARNVPLTADQSVAIRVATPEEGNADTSTHRIDDAFHRLVMESRLGLDPTTALLMMIGSGVTLGGIILLIRPVVWLAAFGCLAGFLAPLGYFAFRRGQRFRQVDEGLPDAIDMMARAVHAGETLEQAIAMVSDEMRGPLAEEFQWCSRQLELGLPASTCMQSLSDRLPLLGIRTLASTLAVHRSTGGNLAVTLERLAEVIRGRLSFHRQVRAATSAGRLSGYCIAAAGPILFVAIMILEPEHVQRLLVHGAGRALLAIAVVLEVVGFTWLRNLTRRV